LHLHRWATAWNGAWVGLGAASSADARPWRARNSIGAKRRSNSAQPLGCRALRTVRCRAKT